MAIETSRFGPIEMEETDMIQFKHGIPGFPENRRFVLIQSEEGPFAYLQAIDNGELAFIILPVFDFFNSYEFELDDATQEELGVQHVEQLQVWGILNVQGDLSEATVNLAAPILINQSNHQATQYILHHTSYHTRHRLYE